MNNKENQNNDVTEIPLIKPSDILNILPADEALQKEVYQSRETINRIIQGHDSKFLVITGPCSLHDEKAALEYAKYLKQAADRYRNELFIVMRTYFSKPRTQKGWKGFIYDPFLDGSQDMEKGIYLTRKLLLELSKIVPLACEFLDIVTPCYLKDLIAWGAIGARTSASQPHRELASGLPMPIGFKNSIDGNIQIAVHAAESAALPHRYFGLSHDGQPAIIQTKGNPCPHVILRGSLTGPNYSLEEINQTHNMLQASQLPSRLIIDCSHDNCSKQFERQVDVVADIIKYLNEKKTNAICGIMLESYLISGKQNINSADSLTYGQSITDPCLSWPETEKLLEQLAQAVKHQRKEAV